MSPRSAFEKQLENLADDMHDMAQIAQACLAHACAIVSADRADQPWPLHAYESDLGQHERDIETQCLHILLLQQPVASDLREVSGALKSVTDFKRIGELSLEVCRVADLMGNDFHDLRDEKLVDMAYTTKRMVDDAIDSYFDHDVSIAHKAAAQDDAIDEFLTCLREETVASIFNRQIDAATGVDLLMIAKYFERIGDHAETLSSWTDYLVCGDEILN